MLASVKASGVVGEERWVLVVCLKYPVNIAEDMLEHVQADIDRYVHESLLRGLGCVFGCIALWWRTDGTGYSKMLWGSQYVWTSFRTRH